MANWDKHKPLGMSRLELEKRVRDGLKKWEKNGWVRPGFNLPVKPGSAIATATEPTLDRKAQKRVMKCADLAIYALANNDRQDYLEAVRVINATRRLAGMSSVFMKAMCEGIAEAAAAASGETFERLNIKARLWLDADLKRAAGRMISLPSKGANDDGKEDRQDAAGDGHGRGEGEAHETGEAEAGAGGAGDQAIEAPGEDDEPELQPGEGGDGAGRAGGSVAADDPDHSRPGSFSRK